MKVIGLILIIAGTVLFLSSKLIYKKNSKKSALGKETDKEEDFLTLLNNGLIVFKIIAAVLIAAGCVFLMLL